MQNAEVFKIRPKFNLTLMNHGSSVETIGFPDETRGIVYINNRWYS